MDDFVTFAAAGGMVWTALSFIKNVRGGRYGDAATLVVLVLVGIAVAFLAAETSYAGAFELSKATWADKVFVGYGISGAARLIYEWTNGKVLSEPKLFQNPGPAE